MKEKQAPYVVTKEVDAKRVSDLLCCALEGGTGYWAQIDNEEGPGYNAQTCDLIAEGRAHLRIIEDCGEGDEPVTHRLDRFALARGLKIMAEKYPKHFGDFLNENEDASTGDVFLQLALLGEIVYG